MKINKCIITAAGYGTRMLPITKTITKEMLNIVDVPAIYYQVKEAYLSGIKEIIFIVRKENKSLLKNFFSYNSKLMKLIENDEKKISLLKELTEIINNVKFHYVIEKEKGSYGAVYSAKKFLSNEYFAVMFSDDIVDSDVPALRQLINEHERTNHMIMSSKNIKYDELPKFGAIKYKKDNLIDSLLYKNEVEESNADVIQGRFILHTKIFTIKNQLKYFNNELQLPNAVLKFQGEVRALNYEGISFDIGNKLGLLKANIYFGLKNNSLNEELRKYINYIK